MIYVLDACAMLALLKTEPGHDVITAALADPDSTCFSHAMNALEVHYIIRKIDGEAQADAAIAQLRALGVDFQTDMDDDLWKLASKFKAGGNIALPDCIVAALSVRLGGLLLTADIELDRLVKAGECNAHFFRTAGPKAAAVSVPLPAAAAVPAGPAAP